MLFFGILYQSVRGATIVIVRSSQQLQKTDRRIVTEKWESLRLLLKADNMGFSFHITTVYEGSIVPMQYVNHLESVYCISGEGQLEVPAEGKIYPIRPGTIYALDQHDKHVLHAFTELKLACVFNPPLNGKEVHDEQGSYPLVAEAVSG
jgi:L-ectoine synthase